MRKVEIAMIAAIRAHRDWISGNTAIGTYRRHDGKLFADVFLHDNHIATVGYEETGNVGSRVSSLSVSLAGWNTATTPSRLSAIVRAFAANTGGHGLGVGTRGGSRGGRDGQASLHDANGKRDIGDSEWNNVALVRS